MEKQQVVQNNSVFKCCPNSMFTKGIILLLIWSAVMHSFNYYLLLIFFYAGIKDPTLVKNAILPVYCVTLIIVVVIYPVAGLIAEIYWNRYKVMVFGTILALIGVTIITLSFLSMIFVSENCKVSNLLNETQQCSITISVVFSCLGVALYLFGLGLFQANAIQFGADQLQFASSEKLSAFVHWYYWCGYVLNLPSFYVADAGFFTVHDNRIFYLSMLCFLTTTFSVLLLIFSCCCFNRHLLSDLNMNANPLKQVYGVLRFVKKHSYPINRSALTYGEIPSRFDYAKERYGGPFSTEQVESVKTLGRMILVLLTVFGGFMEPFIKSNKEIEKLVVGKVLYGNVVNYHFLLLLILIPIYTVFIRPVLPRFSILKKIGAGLAILFLANLLVIPAEVDQHYTILSLLYVIASVVICPFGILLVFLSVFEFILAQGPRSMQGLLIGFFYGYQLLPYLANLFFLYATYERLSIIRTCLCFISFFLFVMVSLWYKKRQRNEYSDVNRHNIIEEYTARGLRKEDSFKLFENTSHESVQLIH